MNLKNGVQKGAENAKMTDAEIRACLRGIGYSLLAVAGNDDAMQDMRAVLDAAMVTIERLKQDVKERP